MEDKTALVIGANGGIGLETSRMLLANGMKVCATYHSNKTDLEQIENSKMNLYLYQMDLLQENSVKSALHEMIKDHRKIDVIVYSVSNSIKNKSIMNMQWKDIQEHLDLQLKGIFYVVQSLKDQIQAKHKTKFIILLTEYCIGKPPLGIAHYVTTKYALMGFAKSMASELAKYNCTVNMVSPGMVATNLLSNLPPKLVEMTAENNPLKRIAVPKDVANVVLFLSRNESDYLNGVNITVNGGGIML